MKWRVISMLILTLIAFCSCRATKVIEPAVVSHDTIYQYKCSYDSIYVHDSIFQVIEHKGDTVYVEKDVYKIQYRDRWRTDSVYISQCDTIVHTVEVEKQLSRIEATEITIGKIAIIVLAIMIFVVVLKKCFLR